MNRRSNFSILVTGGAGFIGTHLVNTLIRLYPGVSVDIVDDLSSSTVNDTRLAFFERHRISFFKMTVEGFTPRKRYDEIYHLASPVGPAGVLKYAGKLGLVILADSIKMAELALRDGAKLLVVSTSEVYGPNPLEKQQQAEDDPKYIPAEPTVRLEYGVGKLLTEVALLNRTKVSPLKVNFVRPFNVVGPFQNGELGFVLPRFIEAAMKDQPLTVFGDGRQERSFTHVDDIVAAFLLVMDSEGTGRIYNVGEPGNICTIGELARKVIHLAGSRSTIAYVDPKQLYGPLYAEAWNKIPDITKITTELGWKPVYSIDDILEECIEVARREVSIRATTASPA